MSEAPEDLNRPIVDKFIGSDDENYISHEGGGQTQYTTTFPYLSTSMVEEGGADSSDGNNSEKDHEEQEGEKKSDDHDEEDSHALEEDVFSMIFVSPICSLPFLYSFFIFSVQIMILTLALINILSDPDPNANIHKIPPHNNLEVTVSQPFAILISLMVSNDVSTSLDVFLVKYDREIHRAFQGATKSKWIFSNLCRFIEGLLGIVVAFIFIIQATNVLDLFLNFLAVQFVSELDNIGFYLANKGYLPSKDIKDLAEEISHIQMKQGGTSDESETIRKARKRIRLGVFYSILVVLYGCWAVVLERQRRGVYFKMECENLQITLPDLNYQFFPKCRDHDNNGYGCPESWKNRTDPIKYSQFNGLYVAVTTERGGLERRDQRPVYRQRLAGDSEFGDDSPPGEIFYCRKEEAWVFSIQHVTKGAQAEDCSWLLKSPETDVLTLNDVPEEDWTVWTGAIDEGTVDITCAECTGGPLAQGQTGHLGCNFHGQCQNDGMCKCEDGFIGTQCSTCSDCSVIDLNSDSVLGSELKEQWPETFHRLDYPDGRAFELYDRPVYYHFTEDTTKDELIVFFYWADQYALWNFSDRVDDRSSGRHVEQLIDVLEGFHPLWDYEEDKMKPAYVSEHTMARLGMKGLKWRTYDEYLKNSDFSIGDYEELNFRCDSYEHGSLCPYAVFE